MFSPVLIPNLALFVKFYPPSRGRSSLPSTLQVCEDRAKTFPVTSMQAPRTSFSRRISRKAASPDSTWVLSLSTSPPTGIRRGWLGSAQQNAVSELSRILPRHRISFQDGILGCGTRHRRCRIEGSFGKYTCRCDSRLSIFAIKNLPEQSSHSSIQRQEDRSCRQNFRYIGL